MTFALLNAELFSLTSLQSLFLQVGSVPSLPLQGAVLKRDVLQGYQPLQRHLWSFEHLAASAASSLAHGGPRRKFFFVGISHGPRGSNNPATGWCGRAEVACFSEVLFHSLHRTGVPSSMA